MADIEPQSSNELATERTHLAADRTVMAADRTLMAWVRTALSLMSFGFTIYKLLQGFQAGGAVLPHADSPRRVGLFLTGLGAVAMVMGMIEYMGVMKELHKSQHYRLMRASFVLAIIMATASLFLFVGIIGKVL